MRRLVIAIPVALMLGAAAPAQALNWSLGANLGFSSVDLDASPDNISVFAWPNAVDWFAPGLRVGFAGDNPQHEFFLDTGLLLVSVSGASQRNMNMVANYQFNFSQNSLSPYVTGGVGLSSFGFDPAAGPSTSVMSMQFGGGVGLRHKMGNGHGVLRGEVRYDRINEGEDSGAIVIPEAGVIGVELGFDLWDK